MYQNTTTSLIILKDAFFWAINCSVLVSEIAPKTLFKSKNLDFGKIFYNIIWLVTNI